MKQINYKLTWKGGYPPMGCVWWRFSKELSLFPGNVIRSHVPCGHLGSSIVGVYMKGIYDLGQPTFSTIRRSKENIQSPKKHISSNNYASAGNVPTPRGSTLHPPRASQVPYRPKIVCADIAFLLYIIT